jgi:IS5 family transposase
MLGKRSAQASLFAADTMYLDFVGRQSFYGFLATQRSRLFRDEDFADLYCLTNGRNSVPPSQVALALLLQAHDRVSDEEAVARADFDIRWKVALGIELDEHPFAKSTLQLFRAHLILHDKVRAVFTKSLDFARETGYLKHRKMKVVLDTTFILGAGAVKDTYNLIADGIMQLVRVLAKLAGQEPVAWAQANSLARYVAPSIKGTAEINWDDAQARQTFLQSIVADADRLLADARTILAQYADDVPEKQEIRTAADLVAQLLLQDIERTPAGAAIKDGTSPDRIVSVHDPEMRHGHKSASVRFEGHKAAVAIDAESQLITAADVLAGNAHDSEQALSLVEQSEDNAQATADVTVGDCAYGTGPTRQAFADAERPLVAPVPVAPPRPNGMLGKGAFVIDAQALTCRCPAGQVTSELRPAGSYTYHSGVRVALQAFQFPSSVCAACTLRAQCVSTRYGGRRVHLHPQEALMQAARAFQESDAYEPYRKLRQAVEHRLARLVQLGIRQARYVGRLKTRFQLLLAATLANLTLVATRTGLMQGRKGQQEPVFSHLLSVLPVFTGRIGLLVVRRTAKQPVFG